MIPSFFHIFTEMFWRLFLRVCLSSQQRHLHLVIFIWNPNVYLLKFPIKLRPPMSNISQLISYQSPPSSTFSYNNDNSLISNMWCGWSNAYPLRFSARYPRSSHCLSTRNSGLLPLYVYNFEIHESNSQRSIRNRRYFVSTLILQYK